MEQLAKKYYVSPSTIRRDLREMEEAGILRRIYGGAVLKEKESIELPYELRLDENKKEKNRMCELAAELVQDEMCVFLDTTTTISYLPSYLGNKNNIKLITNSISIAMEGLNYPNMQVYSTGGWVNPISKGFAGEAARRGIKEFYSDILFFSARTLSRDRGIMDLNEEDVYMKKLMIENTRKVVLLADHTKWDRESYLGICGIERVDVVITDQRPDEVWLELLKEKRIELIFGDLT